MMSFSYKNASFWSFVLFFLVFFTVVNFTGCKNNIDCGVEAHQNNPNLCSDKYSFDDNKKPISGNDAGARQTNKKYKMIINLYKWVI